MSKYSKIYLNNKQASLMIIFCLNLFFKWILFIIPGIIIGIIISYIIMRIWTIFMPELHEKIMVWFGKLPKLDTLNGLLTAVFIVQLFIFLLPVIIVLLIFLVLILFVSLFTKVNDSTFKHFFYVVNPKIKETNLKRIIIEPPTNLPNTIFETKQVLFKALHSVGGVQVQMGEFTGFLNNKDLKGHSIWSKYFKSKKEVSKQISVGFSSNANQIRQFIDVPENNVKSICSVIESVYKGARLAVVDTPRITYNFKGIIGGDWRSRLRTFKDEQVDPLNSIVQILEKSNQDIEIKYNLIPLGDFYNAIIDEKLENLPIEDQSGGAKNQSLQAMSQEKASSLLFKFEIQVSGGKEIIEALNIAYLQIQEVEKNYITFEKQYSNNWLNQSVVGEADLWSLWHIYTGSPKIQNNRHIELPYPNELLKFDKFITVFGKSNYPNFTDKDVGIPTVEDKYRHRSLLGRTRSGKSTLLRHLFKQDVAEGFPMFFMDFKGETAPDILSDIDGKRRSDIVYLSPDNILPMSVFDGGKKQIMLLLDMLDAIGNINLVGGFGDKVERNANVLATIIAESKSPTVRGMQNYINEILNSKEDIKLLKMSDDQRIKVFGTSIDVSSKQKVVEYLSSVINKLDKLLVDDTCIKLIDNPKATLNFKDCIRDNKIVIINLPESIGEREKVSLGIFYTLKILYAIKSQKKKEAKQTAFYLDEAQVIMNMLAEQFESSFSQLGGLKCAMTIANQYTAQANIKVVDSIKSNVATQIVLGLLDDEQIIQQANSLGIDLEFYDKNNFRLLPLGTGYIRTIANGSILPTCTFTFPMLEKRDTSIKDILKLNKLDYFVGDYKFSKEGIKKVSNDLMKKTILTKRPDRRNVKKIKSL